MAGPDWFRLFIKVSAQQIFVSLKGTYRINPVADITFQQDFSPHQLSCKPPMTDYNARGAFSLRVKVKVNHWLSQAIEMPAG